MSDIELEELYDDVINSPDEQEETIEVKKPVKEKANKKGMTERQAQARLDNLKKARESRQKQVKQRKQEDEEYDNYVIPQPRLAKKAPTRQKPVYEEYYDDDDDYYEDDPAEEYEERPAKQSRRAPPPQKKQLSKAEIKKMDRLDKMEAILMNIHNSMKKTAKKRAVVNQTVVQIPKTHGANQPNLTKLLKLF